MIIWLLKSNLSTLLIVSLLQFLSYPSMAGQKALLIIDVQDFFQRYWGAHWRYGNPERLRDWQQNQIDLIRAAKVKNIPVIVVEMWDDRIDYGKTQPYILAAIGNYSKFKVIQKSKDSVFQLDNLSRDLALQTLKEWNVDELILIGANGTVCVRYTMQDALKAGFKVSAFTLGIIDMAYSDREFTYPFSFRSWHETKDDFTQYQKLGFAESDSIKEILDSSESNSE